MYITMQTFSLRNCALTHSVPDEELTAALLIMSRIDKNAPFTGQSAMVPALPLP